MNRSALVIAAVLGSLSSGFAVDLVSTNIVGADGLPGVDAVSLFSSDPGPHSISNSTLTGGSALSVTTNSADIGNAIGGNGFRMGGFGFPLLNRDIFIDGESILQGGQGGTVTIAGETLIADVNVSGGVGLSALRGKLYATNSSFYGGDGGTVTATDPTKEITADGGAGFTLSGGASQVVIIDLTDVYVEGGQGGTIRTKEALNTSSANGGNGATILSSANNNWIVDSEFVGGDGGFFNSSRGVATANGGAGLSATDFSGSLIISNSVLTGGNGGTAEGNSLSTQNGGVGLLLVNADNVTIIDSTLSGGINTNNLVQAAGLEMQDSTVDLLGAALNGGIVFSGTGTNTISMQSTTNNEDVVQSTTITGGARQTGGTVNVNAWDDEHFQDTSISDGTMNFIGQDFSLTTFTLGSSNAVVNFSQNLNINTNGALDVGAGSVVVVSNVLADTGATLTVGEGSVDVGGGDMTLNAGSSLTVGGGSVIVGSNLLAAANTTLTVGDGLVDVGEDMTLNAGSSLTVDGGAFDIGGDVTLNAASLTVGAGSVDVGGDALFDTAAALNIGAGSFDTAGGLTFTNNATLDLGSGSVNAGGNMTFDSGTTLNVGTGSVVGGGDVTINSDVTLGIGTGSVDAGGDLLIDSGNTIYAAFDGSNVGTFSAANDLTISNNVNWQIDAGNVLVTNNTAFKIASAGGLLTHQVTTNDIELIGSEVIIGWLAGIQAIEDTGGVLQAIYVQDEINKALGVENDQTTDYGKAMADLTKLVPAGTDEYVAFANLTNSKAATAVLMTNSYLRATEMASSLIGLQSIFADQIKDRTRSRLHQQKVGYPSASTPAGSAGWEAMRQYSDRMEDRFGYDDVMDSVNAAVPDVSFDDLKVAVDKVVPYVSFDDMKDSVDKVVPDVSYDDVKAWVDEAVPGVKTDKVVIPPSYQTWGRGYGSFSEQKTIDGIVGYDATIGGGVLGIDKEIDNMLVGIAGGYARTVLNGDAGKDGISDTGHVTAYFSAHGEHAYLDANASYAYNGVDTEYNRLGYSGDYVAHTMGFYLGGGYAFPVTKNILLTPEASILSALYKRDGYTETSNIYPDLKWDAYDQWSHLGAIGGTLTMIQYLDFRDAEMAIQPEVRVHLLHEFNNEFDDETYMMADGDYTIGASLKAREENLVKVGAGVRLSQWSSDTTEFGLDFDGAFGDDFTAYIVSGKFLHRF